MCIQTRTIRHSNIMNEITLKIGNRCVCMMHLFESLLIEGKSTSESSAPID